MYLFEIWKVNLSDKRHLTIKLLYIIYTLCTCTLHVVSILLIWLHVYIFRYDPSADINGDTDTEQDRIIFIKSVAEFMV